MIRSISRLALGAAITLSALSSAHAHAQERTPRTRDDVVGFGDKGEIAISTDAALSFGRTTQDGSPSATALSVLPAADVFVIRNLSIGGFLGVRYQKQGESKSTSFQIGPRVGYNIELMERLSVWPKLGLSYSHTKAESDVLVDGDRLSRSTKNDALGLNLFVPVMVHPAPHFFAGFGPYLDTDLNGDHRATTWGFRLTVGGWIKP